MYRQDRLCGFEATHYTIDGLKQIGVQKRKEEFGDLCLKGRKRKKRVIVTQWTLELPQRLHKRRSVRRSILKGREMGHIGTSSKAAQKKKRSDIYLEKTRKGSSSLKRTFELLQRLHIQKREGSMIFFKGREQGHPHSDEHWNCFKGYSLSFWETDWNSFSLSRVHPYYLKWAESVVYTNKRSNAEPSFSGMTLILNSSMLRASCVTLFNDALCPGGRVTHSKSMKRKRIRPTIKYTLLLIHRWSV